MTAIDTKVFLQTVIKNYGWVENTPETLPEEGQEVLVWMKYRSDSHYQHNTSTLAYSDDGGIYIEPNSGRNWHMGSATGYTISHWKPIVGPNGKTFYEQD